MASRLRRWLLLVGAGLLATSSLPAQDFAPPPGKLPDEATLKSIQEKTSQLSRALARLRKQGLRDPWLAEAEVYHQAAEWIVQHREFFHPDAATWTLEALDRGLLRSKFLAQGEFPWAQAAGHAVVRAYRSRLDGSVQPYAVTLPANYGRDPNKKYRLDVVLHGRDKTLTEIKFLHNHNGDKAAPADQHFIRLDIYGRGNNAYRWAGEMDVLEAIDHFSAVEKMLEREQLLDGQRLVLRGFSMGGAGTWHLGLHRPDRWCVLGPGAGFTTTHGYVPKLPAELPPYQEACLHIYDAVDYAENAFNVPLVAFSGDQDPQMQAAVNIENKLKKLGIPMTHLIAPDLGHQFPPAWQKKAEEHYAKHAARGRPEYPPHVRFLTYTMRYPSCYWVEILGLDKHYEKALVDARKTDEGFTVATTNVRALHLVTPDGATPEVAVVIDNQKIPAHSWPNQVGNPGIYLVKRGGRWQSVLPQIILTNRVRVKQKITGLQGPIDDAFTDAFLCVRGTEKSWHAATGQYAEANLKRFQDEWAKYLRGHLPIKDDVDVTTEDIAAKHLVLFGDPASNALIAQALLELPLQWTKDSIVFAGKKYSSAEHVPVLIHPSPLNPARYVVLNSGHTFGAADFQGTNALLFPRLGDYAVLKLAATAQNPLAVEVSTAGLFDDFWKINP